MASTITAVAPCTTRPALRVSAKRSARPVCRAVRVTAAAQKQESKVPVAAAATLSAVAMAASAPAVQAAQEFAMTAEGEPLLVQVGWAATAVLFTFSLSLVVWGRSGM